MTHYDGFESRAILLRQTLDSICSDDEYDKIFELFNKFGELEEASHNDRNNLFIQLNSILKDNAKKDELIELTKAVLMGNNKCSLPDLTINVMSNKEVRQRDAERHTLIALRHKYRYHSNENLPV